MAGDDREEMERLLALAELKERESRRKRTERQRRWRQRNIEDRESRIGASLTVHLNALEVALLDLIARQDYERRPNGRTDGADLMAPSRARAMRILIQRYREIFEIGPEQLAPYMERNRELGRFWIQETAWRRSSSERRHEVCDDGSWRLEQPLPPWKEAQDGEG
ncbi:MAG TPA: hypothetical protein VED40_05715 [Azospirillaceae bacterium]|nr:hypothetical protein [Azospirillaceae bacterium]